MVVDINLSLPLINSIRGTWKVSDLERSAAWEAYIEIITRISPCWQGISQRDMEREMGVLEDLLNKLRDILKKYGPLIGKTEGVNDLSFALLTLMIINVVLRPLLLKGEKIKCTNIGNQDIVKAPFKGPQVARQAPLAGVQQAPHGFGLFKNFGLQV